VFAIQPSWAWTPEGVKPDPVVTIDDGVIIRCCDAARHSGPAPERLPGRLLLPGLVDAHSHAFQRAFRGHVQWRRQGDDDFWSWRQAMYKVAGRLSPAAVQAVSELAFLELVEGGVTHVGEFHYLHHQPDGTPYADPDELALRVIAAAARVGLRITLLWVVYGRGGPGTPLSAEQRRFSCASPAAALAAAERLAGRCGSRAAVGLAPHSVRAVHPSWWAELAAWPGVLHAHVSEQPRENAQCHAEVGLSPIALLEREGVLSDRFAAVHLTHPEPGDVDALRRAGAGVVVCPSTELDLGDGFLPNDVRLGLPLALGSDSHALSDLWRETRALEMHARALAQSRNVLTPTSSNVQALASRLLGVASAGGARALGVPPGRITDGAPADLVALDLRRPAAIGQPPLVAAALSANAGWVDQVWVAGRRVVRHGRHADRDEILRAALPFLGG